jgi:hypothetical protein
MQEVPLVARKYGFHSAEFYNIYDQQTDFRICSVLNGNLMTRKLEDTGKFSFAPLSKVWLTLNRFSRIVQFSFKQRKEVECQTILIELNYKRTHKI